MLLLVLIKTSRKVLIQQSVFNVLLKKKVWKRVKILIPAGQAKVAPPISSILGQFGVNLLDFCDTFNNKTKQFSSELSFLVYVTIFTNKSYIFKLKSATLNELFFSFDILSLFCKCEGDFYKNHLILDFYKLFAVYMFVNHNLNIFTNSQSKLLLRNLNQIVGYFFSFSNSLKTLNQSK